MKINSRLKPSVWLAFLIACIAIASPAEPQPHLSGIVGHAFLDYPVVHWLDGTEHGGPATVKTMIAIYSSETGQLIHRVHTDAKGRFQVPLRPGVYLVTTDTIWLGAPGPLTPRWLAS